MPSMDVFNSDAFSMRSLTAALMDKKHLPRRLTEMGLFQENGIRTLNVSVERKGDVLQLVPVTERNAPATQLDRNTRDMLDLRTVRLAIEDTVVADEVQNVRSFGSETDLEQLQSIVLEKALAMSNSIEATIEYHRVSALNGLVLDASGSTLYDLAALFNVTLQSERTFNHSTMINGALRTEVSTIIRLIEDELDGLSYTGLHAMCSPQFFDAFVANAEFRAGYLQTPNATTLHARTARGQAVEFGGITWEEYRGSVGGTAYVPSNKCRIFPTGVPDMFITRYAPAEYWDTVNTVGMPRYVRQIMEDSNDSKRTFRVQSQLLNVCTRPRAMIMATI